MKPKITRESEWLGNGFGFRTLHTARLGETVIGEWDSQSLTRRWVADERAAWSFAEWRKRVREAKA